MDTTPDPAPSTSSNPLCDLFRCRVGELKPTPAGVSPSRLWGAQLDRPDDLAVLLASGPTVYSCHFTFPESVATDGARKRASGFVSAPVTRDALTPTAIPVASPAKPSEIQSLDACPGTEAGTYTCGTVDAMGRVVQSILAWDTDAQSFSVRSSAVLESKPCRESGWHGVAVNPSRQNYLATAGMFDRTVNLFDDGRLCHTFSSSHPLSQVSFLRGDYDQLLAATEGSFLTVWDPRVAERGGVVFSESLGTQHLLALHASATAVSVAGTRGCVTAFDPKTWRAASMWQTPSKYDVVGIRMSSDASFCYSFGTDNEVLCGNMVPSAGSGGGGGGGAGGPGAPPKKKKQRKLGKKGGGGAGREVNVAGFTGLYPSEAHTPGKLVMARTTGFRGDSRWVGSSLIEGDKDTVLALSSTGHLYVARDARLLYPL